MLAVEPQARTSGTDRARFVPPAPTEASAPTSLLAMALRLRRSQIEAWPPALYRDHSWRAPGGTLFVMSREAVRAVLHDQADDFSHGALFRRTVRPAWGRGLLTAQGHDWRVQRRATSRAFRPADMAALAPFFAAAAERAVARWTAGPAAGAAAARLDMLAEMTRLTFDVVLDTTLSGAAGVDRDAVRPAIERLFARVNRVPLAALLVPDRFHEGRPSARLPERAMLLATIGGMIARRRTAAPTGDLLDLLIAARDPETGDALDDALLADNLLGFILAGHETTTLALTWSLFLAAAHPPTLGGLRREVATVAGDASIAPEHLPRLVFTRQVISEAMRLYPPAFLLTRIASRDTAIPGHRVRAGQRVNIPVYALHRRADRFADPDSFDPDRFTPDRALPDRYSYLPFGAGPRVCLGASFAMAEATCVLATIVRAVDLEVIAPAAVWPIAQLSLRPRAGLAMRVTGAR